VATQHYYAPSSLDDAIRLLQQSANASVLAGGTDLLVQMKLGVKTPEVVIDIKRIPELLEWSMRTEGLRLGAAVPAAAITADTTLTALYPGFIEALDLIGSSQIQGRCSAGGNLCNSSPAADSVPALIANQALCNIVGPNGARQVAAESFATDPGSNCLAKGEFLVSLDIPKPQQRSSDAYLRFIPRSEMDIAVAGAAVALSLDELGVCTHARVVIGAVAPRAILVPGAADALIGERVNEENLQRAGAAASAAASPIDYKRGTAEFRKHIVGVLVKRAAKISEARILESSGASRCSSHEKFM